MEQSLSYIKEAFGVKGADIATYSPLTLAYIGDAVYELIVRSYLVEKGNDRPDNLHKRASTMVKAATQASMAEILLPDLTEEEADIYRRGRNAKSGTMAKNASMTDYRKATGFEALMGYLYLTGQTQRMIDLAQKGLEECHFVKKRYKEENL